jgi:hypothetical protein
MMRSLLCHANRRSLQKVQKGAYTLITSVAQKVKAYVFVRSFQETERQEHGTPAAALDADDPKWRERSLIIMPSHPEATDCKNMIEVAQSAGFDAVVVPVLMQRDEISADSRLTDCVTLNWDVRWTVDNPEKSEDWKAQAEVLGRDLWVAISRLLFPA